MITRCRCARDAQSSIPGISPLEEKNTGIPLFEEDSEEYARNISTGSSFIAGNPRLWLFSCSSRSRRAGPISRGWLRLPLPRALRRYRVRGLAARTQDRITLRVGNTRVHRVMYCPEEDQSPEYHHDDRGETDQRVMRRTYGRGG